MVGNIRDPKMKRIATREDALAFIDEQVKDIR